MLQQLYLRHQQKWGANMAAITLSPEQLITPFSFQSFPLWSSDSLSHPYFSISTFSVVVFRWLLLPRWKHKAVQIWTYCLIIVSAIRDDYVLLIKQPENRSHSWSVSVKQTEVKGLISVLTHSWSTFSLSAWTFFYNNNHLFFFLTKYYSLKTDGIFSWETRRVNFPVQE